MTSVLATTGDCNCSGIHTYPCILATTMELENSKSKYEEIVVNDLDSKYRVLYEAAERQISRLEAEIERLRSESNQVQKPAFDPTLNPSTSTSLPQGIQLPSTFRASIEEKLRQRAFGLKKQEEEVSKENDEV